MRPRHTLPSGLSSPAFLPSCHWGLRIFDPSSSFAGDAGLPRGGFAGVSGLPRGGFRSAEDRLRLSRSSGSASVAGERLGGLSYWGLIGGLAKANSSEAWQKKDGRDCQQEA